MALVLDLKLGGIICDTFQNLLENEALMASTIFDAVVGFHQGFVTRTAIAQGSSAR